MQYITVADVDTALGSNWADDDKKQRNVASANAWLTAKLYQYKDIPDDVIKEAGSLVAEASSNGELYVQQSQGSLTSESAKAGSVQYSESYQSLDSSNLNTPNGWMSPLLQQALDLLQPYRGRAVAFRVCRG